MKANENILKESRILPFTQVGLAIKKLLKRDVDEICDPMLKTIRLSSDKNFQIDIDENDPQKLRVISNMIVYAFDGDSEAPQNKRPFIDIDVEIIYLVQDDIEILEADIIQKLLISQSNVQVVDIVNFILRNSELKGEDIQYNI